MVGSIVNTNPLLFLAALSLVSLYLIVGTIHNKIKKKDTGLELFPLAFLFLFSTLLGVAGLLILK